MIIVLVGLIIGAIWFIYFERINEDKMNIIFKEKQCWEYLHYFDKKIPLYVVHAKSIIAGIILIILGYSKYHYKNSIIIFIGSAIIGLHLLQIINELNFIKYKKYATFIK